MKREGVGVGEGEASGLALGSGLAVGLGIGVVLSHRGRQRRCGGAWLARQGTLTGTDVVYFNYPQKPHPNPDPNPNPNPNPHPSPSPSPSPSPITPNPNPNQVQGTVKGLDLVDFNYPQHLKGVTHDQARVALETAGLKAGSICMRCEADPPPTCSPTPLIFALTLALALITLTSHLSPLTAHPHRSPLTARPRPHPHPYPSPLTSHLSPLTSHPHPHTSPSHFTLTLHPHPHPHLSPRYEKEHQSGAFTHPNEALRRKAIELTKEGARWALALGASELVIWSAFDGCA